MELPEPASELSPAPTSEENILHWPSVWQFGFSVLAALSLWGLALIFTLLGFGELLSSSGQLMGATAQFLVAANLLLSGILVLPSAGFALARLTRTKLNLPSWLTLGKVSRLIWILPIVILVGHWISSSPMISWLALPVFHVMAVGLPILWLVWRGSRGLPLGPPQRAWGVFGVGLVVGPTLILIMEILAVLFIIFLAAVYIAADPELLRTTVELADRLQTLGPDPEELSALLEPLLVEPAVLSLGFLYIAVIVPLIEEFFKPVGVWFLARHKLTPTEGFVAGLLSGGGYALFENLALSGQAESWALAVSARAGTGLLHMITSGLVGWALVQAWQSKRYLQLGLAYIIAVVIHGMWNGLTLMTLFSALNALELTNLRLPVGIGQTAPIGLALLALVTLVLLVGANRLLQPQDPEAQPPLSDSPIAKNLADT